MEVTNDKVALLSHRILDDQLNTKVLKIDPACTVKLLDDDHRVPQADSAEKRLESKGISMKDHILEEVKGRDSPIKIVSRPSNKFSPSKKEYQTTQNKDKLKQEFFFKNIGDSTDSEDEGAGRKGAFRLHKMD